MKYSLYLTIRKEFFDSIKSGKKKIEYREIKQYWTDKLSKLQCPFTAMFQNGYSPNSPRLYAVINRIEKDEIENVYKLHIGGIQNGC